MVANETEARDWLARRIKWEHTLRTLHDRRQPAPATDADLPATELSAPAPSRGANVVAAEAAESLPRPGAWSPLRSPVRGMSRRFGAAKIRT
jgi:hypothetical protein